MLGYIAPFKAWAIAILLSAAIAAIGLHVYDYRQAKAKVVALEIENAELRRKNQTADLAVQVCKAVNLENQRRAEINVKRAAEAAARSATRNKEAEDEVTQIRHESAQFGHADCPALDDGFRDWLRK